MQTNSIRCMCYDNETKIWFTFPFLLVGKNQDDVRIVGVISILKRLGKVRLKKMKKKCTIKEKKKDIILNHCEYGFTFLHSYFSLFVYTRSTNFKNKPPFKKKFNSLLTGMLQRNIPLKNTLTPPRG